MTVPAPCRRSGRARRAGGAAAAPGCRRLRSPAAPVVPPRPVATGGAARPVVPRRRWCRRGRRRCRPLPVVPAEPVVPAAPVVPPRLAVVPAAPVVPPRRWECHRHRSCPRCRSRCHRSRRCPLVPAASGRAGAPAAAPPRPVGPPPSAGHGAARSVAAPPWPASGGPPTPPASSEPARSTRRGPDRPRPAGHRRPAGRQPELRYFARRPHPVGEVSVPRCTGSRRRRLRERFPGAAVYRNSQRYAHGSLARTSKPLRPGDLEGGAGGVQRPLAGPSGLTESAPLMIVIRSGASVPKWKFPAR